MMDKKKKRLLILAAFGVLLIGAAAFSPYRLIIVSGESMSPTYHSGRLLLGRKQLFCRNIPFRRGEVVLFRHENETCLKRIYALPGDEVVIFRLDEGFNLLVQRRRSARRELTASRFRRVNFSCSETRRRFRWTAGISARSRKAR